MKVPDYPFEWNRFMCPDLKNQTVFVLDAHGILHQLFHALPEMSSPQGEPVGVVFGFVRDLITLLSKHKPDYLFCAYDLPGGTFRNTLYPKYKENRKEMPESLRPQIAFSRDVLDAFAVPILAQSGFEADDVLATVSVAVERAGGKCVLVTSDKDCRQLLSDHVSLYQLRKEEFYTAKELLADWGIKPNQVVDFQALTGDSSDNVPGVPLIGPKIATELITKYGTLENVLDRASEISGAKRKQNLLEGREIAMLSRDLVKLRNDVPLDFQWESGKFLGIDPEKLKTLFRRFGFRSLLPKIGDWTSSLGIRPDAVSDSLVSNSTIDEEDGSSEEQSLFSFRDSRNSSQKNSPQIKGSRKGENFDDADKFSDFDESNEPDDHDGDLPLFKKTRNTRIPEIILAPSHVSEKKTQNSFPLVEVNKPFEPIAVRAKYHLVDTEELFNAFFSQLEKVECFSFDSETTDIRPRFASIVGLSFCWSETEAWYIPFRGPLGATLLNATKTLEKLRPILENPSVGKIGQNLKYDRIVLRNAGIRMRGTRFDTIIADYLLRSGEQNHNLDDMSELYLGHTTIKIAELIGTGKKQKRMDDVPTNIVCDYAAEDALIPWLLYPILDQELKRNPLLFRLFTDWELPLSEVLAEMEFEGIAIDLPILRELSGRFALRLQQLEKEIHEIAGEPFNIASPKQLQKILFEQLNLPVIKKTKTGPSTDIEVLEELAPRHELPAKIIEYRQLSKLKGTYIDALPEMIHPETQRVHTSFNQVVAATGRLSSSDPNLQNIPIRTVEGREIRSAFIPDVKRGFDRFLSCDYSQIELRVLAHFSQDENLCRAFETGEDIHTSVASQVFGVPLAEVGKDMRRKAKAVNFGVIYGQSAFGLSKQLGIPQEEAAEFIAAYFAKYNGIRRYLEKILDDCQQNGYVSTLLGRRRLISGVRSVRKGGQMILPERTAVNTVIQGSAADLMKQAMLQLSRVLSNTNLKTKMLLQIHDELLFEVHHSDLEPLKEIVVREMSLNQPLRVPLVVDAKVGTNWMEY